MTNESVTTSPNMLVICSHRLKNWSTGSCRVIHHIKTEASEGTKKNIEFVAAGERKLTVCVTGLSIHTCSSKLGPVPRRLVSTQVG